MYDLRGYQDYIENRIRQAIAAGKKSILIVMPTGSGKTVVFAHIACLANLKGKIVYTLAHREEIFRQILEKYYLFGVSAGQIYASRPMTRNPIQVGMVQTMVNRLDNLPDPHLIIIDEGHHARAASWMKILARYPNAVKLFFTATPERFDGQGMGDICDCMIEGASVAELIRDGWLVFPRILQPPPELVKDYSITRGDFDAKEQQQWLSRRVIVGNVIEHHREYLAGMPTISFVANLAHGAFMENVYRDAGIKAKMIQGGQKYMKERNKACRELGDGTIEILISCNVISEGFDLPAVCGCHLLRRTMSLALNDQQMGRTLRPIYAPGFCLDTVPGRLAAIKASCKPVAHILDFVGNSFIHPHLLTPREWNLESKKRGDKKRDIRTVTCPRCDWTAPGLPHRCPACGYDYTRAAAEAKQKKIETIEADLVDAYPGMDANGLHELAIVIASDSPGDKKKFIFRQAIKLVPRGDRAGLGKLARAVGYNPGVVEAAWNWAKKQLAK